MKAIPPCVRKNGRGQVNMSTYGRVLNQTKLTVAPKRSISNGQLNDGYNCDRDFGWRPQPLLSVFQVPSDGIGVDRTHKVIDGHGRPWSIRVRCERIGLGIRSERVCELLSSRPTSLKDLFGSLQAFR